MKVYLPTSTFATPRTLLHGRVEAARAAAHVAQEEVAAHLADDSHDDDKEVSKEAASTHLGQVQETQEAGGQQPGGPWRHHGSLITRENGGQSLSSAAYHHAQKIHQTSFVQTLLTSLLFFYKELKMSVAMLLRRHRAPEWRSSSASGPEPWASSSPHRAPLASCLFREPSAEFCRGMFGFWIPADN